MKQLHLFALLSCMVASCAYASSAQADEEADREAARTLFYRASTAMAERDYASAAELFAKSFEYFASPTAGVGEARALIQLGKLVAARTRYQAVLQMPLGEEASPAFQQAHADARKELEAVETRIPYLVIEVPENSGAKVTVDGAPWPAEAFGTKRALDPGVHRVVAKGAGGLVYTSEITLSEAQVLEVVIRLRSAAPTKPAPVEPREAGATIHEIAGWVSVGLAGAAFGAWAITGGIYLADASTVEDECNQARQCTPDGIAAADRGYRAGVANTVSAIAGLIFGTTGVVLLLTAPSSVSMREVHVTFAGTALAVGVSF